MATLMERNLMKLRIGAIVEMTYDEGDISNKKIAGVVIENDGIEGLQVRLKNGEESVITYSLVRSFKEVKEYGAQIDGDSAIRGIFINNISAYQIQCECGLDLLEEAEASFALLHAGHPRREFLRELLEQTRQRLQPAEPEQPEASEAPAEPEEDIPLVPYKDHDGWEALKTTKQEVVDYALAIPGPDRIAPMLAYLRVGAELNPQIRPVYHTVALAANDPLESLDYSTTALITALSENDTEYPELNNLCMGAAFLRSSFLYGRDIVCNNYGTADQIAEYLAFLGGEETVTFPEKREDYINRTKAQIEIRYTLFGEWFFS